MCLLCGTAARSWHRDELAPLGTTIGEPRCASSHVGTDALGVAEWGRVLVRSPEPGAGEVWA